jgi:selenoprotein W-related protein
LASHLLETFKQQISSLELEPAGGGCYEITVNGDLVYSKLSTGEFPADEAVSAKLSELL